MGEGATLLASGWMTKFSDQDPREGGRDSSVADNLIHSSRSFARSAMRAYTSEEWPLYYLHLATAVEHLVKGVLAGINPLFIADTRGGFDSILHLAGMGDRARTPDFVTAVRTIPMREALERVARIVDTRSPGLTFRYCSTLETASSMQGTPPIGRIRLSWETSRDTSHRCSRRWA
jgi:hypothetical protein